MKQSTLIFLLAILLGWVNVQASAHDIAVANDDGVTIYYVFNSNKTELAVSCRGRYYYEFDNEYSGNVVIPSSVTYNGNVYPVTSLGIAPFSGCSSLTSITIPESVTSIGNSAFYDCSGLTSIAIPESVISIGNSAFYGCRGLTAITIPEGVTNIDGSAFQYCTSLTSITIPESVTSIGHWAFEGCDNLKKVIVPNLTAWCNISFESSYSNPLHYAHYLYSDEDTEIINLVIPEGITNIGAYAFCDCSGLTSITIPEGCTSIGKGAFNGCSGLTSITIPNSINSIGNSAFYGCSCLTSVTIPNGVPSIGSSAFYECSSLYSINIPNSVTSIGDAAFANCSSLSSITIPESVTSIGNSAFHSCSSLNSITIPKSITSIEGATFYKCSGLTSISIPNSVTTIGDGAFTGCNALTSVTIPNSVTSIGVEAFKSCGRLASITIPSSVISIGNNAFSYCYFLGTANIHIKDIQTWCENSFSSAFINGCQIHLFKKGQEVTSIVMPSDMVNIKENTFRGCAGLTQIVLPDNVKYIREGAFTGCSGLKDITLPETVEVIYQNAFVGTAIESIKCLAETPSFAYDNTFGNYSIPLYVPETAIDAYNAKSPWNKFSTIKTLDGGDVEYKQCAKPTISYKNGKLTFACETDGVEFVSAITSEDIKTNYTAEVDLTVTYRISVYATREGFIQSEIATATLCWIDATPTGEGFTDGVETAEIKAVPVLVQADGSGLSIVGAESGTPIQAYDLSGKLLSTATAVEGTTHMSLAADTKLVILCIGSKSMKVMVK